MKKAVKWRSYADDYERIADNLELFGGSMIDDEKTFKQVYSEYMDGAGTDVNSKKFRDGVFDKYVQRHIDKFPKQAKKTFKDAGGKNLERDRQQTAKTVVKNKQEYIKRGAQNVDLEGLDTKLKKGIRIARFRIKGKPMTRGRDSKGRFVSLK